LLRKSLSIRSIPAGSAGESVERNYARQTDPYFSLGLRESGLFGSLPG